MKLSQNPTGRQLRAAAEKTLFYTRIYGLLSDSAVGLKGVTPRTTSFRHA